MDLPVIRTLTPHTATTRKVALLPGLARRAESREDTADGVRFRFSVDAFSMLVSTVEAERQCCRFLRFDISIEPDGGPIWLSLSGPAWNARLLTALLES